MIVALVLIATLILFLNIIALIQLPDEPEIYEPAKRLLPSRTEPVRNHAAPAKKNVRIGALRIIRNQVKQQSIEGPRSRLSATD
jgi:hypothetical protein